MSEKLSLFDLVGDMVVFRDLNPVDARLPRFDDAWPEMGLAGPVRPRKHEPAYAQAVVWLLRKARGLDNPLASLAEIVYLGDTALSDGNAFRNLRAAGGWRGWAFIGAERDEESSVLEKDGVYVANRWRALADFVALLLGLGAALDPRTAVIVDIDKTALGARGRNDQAIDRARMAAMEAMIADLVGPGFDQALFQRVYGEFNSAAYHSFTADNQDYLAYICLMVDAGACRLDELAADVAEGRLHSFPEFLARLDTRVAGLPGPVRAAHDEVLARVRAGDPTPFKTFRRREYVETIGRMGNLPDDAPLGQRLTREICLTREVVDLLGWLRGRGCLLLALSDKPDEASLPTGDLSGQGCLPLHRAPTHVVGQAIAHLLPK